VSEVKLDPKRVWSQRYSFTMRGYTEEKDNDPHIIVANNYGSDGVFFAFRNKNTCLKTRLTIDQARAIAKLLNEGVFNQEKKRG
jgi:hypothetical protein